MYVSSVIPYTYWLRVRVICNTLNLLVTCTSSESVLLVPGNLKKYSFLLPYTFEKYYVHDYNVHEALYQKYEIHSPWVKDSFRAGLIWIYSKNVINLRISSLLSQ